MKVEQSQIAQTRATANLPESSETNPISNKFEDLQFPIYDKFTRFCHLPKIFYSLLLYFVIFQQFLMGFRISSNPSIQTSTSLDSKILVALREIACLSPSDNDTTSLLPTMIVHNIIFFVQIVSLIAVILSFRFTRTLSNPLLYFSRFFIEILSVVLLNPIGKLIGRSIQIIGLGSAGSFEIITLILYFLNYCYDQFLFSYVLRIINESAYLQPHSLTAFNYSMYSWYIVGNSAFDMLNMIFQLYPQWVNYIVLVAHICFTCFNIFRLKKLIFTHKLTSILFLASAIVLVPMDVFTLFTWLFPSIPHYVILSSGFFSLLLQ
jgi:hypothetical protein